ncbi:hypothetical protein ACB092_07G080900 [Castanea dentata]
MGKVAVAVIVSLWLISVSILVNRIVPEPYMDEIFHITQAQQYCIGNFRSWDPMITTPPGLGEESILVYLAVLLELGSLAIYFLAFQMDFQLNHECGFCFGTIFHLSMFIVPEASSFSEVCTTAFLRTLNGVLAVLCSIIVYEIFTFLRPTLSERKATIFAVVLALYPLHWFFTFLYYTDVASLTAVLAMYLACLKKSYWCRAVLGALAVVIRQTIIVWMLFVACPGVINITLVRPRDNVEENNIDTAIRKTNRSTSNDNVTSNSNLRRRKFSNALGTDKQSMPSASFFSTNHSSTLWHRKWELLVFFSPFLMIMYFGLVSALAVAPLHCSIGQIMDMFQSFWKRRPTSFFQMLIAVIAGFFSVHFYSIAHPYLIADKRHYPFSLWRKVINVHWSMKYLLVPLYVYSWFFILSTLRKIWILEFFLASAADLVPALLIEFRYYTIPLFHELHSHISDYQSWLLMGLIYLALNVFTMTIFLFRPFHWDHEAGIQRFIW